MEVMRLQTVHLINIQLKTSDRIKDPRYLMKFEWEKEIEEDIETLEEKDWEELDKMFVK